MIDDQYPEIKYSKELALIITNFITFFAVMLLIIYIRTKPSINFKRGINIQICIAITIKDIDNIVSFFFFSKALYPCKVLFIICC